MKKLQAFGGMLVALLTALCSVDGQVTLSTDFTDPDQEREALYTFWDVHNRVPPHKSINVPALGKEGAKINTVRMLGGWGSQDTSVDAYKWDGEKYVYDWVPLKERIDAVLGSGMIFHQFVLDNPPWAFQHGLTFVEENDGVHYLAKDRNATYGNPLPPNDPDAWKQFIEAMLVELVDTYGRDVVEKWRFRVGSEIDTRPGHWAGTMQQFFDHYEDTSNVVWSVLPSAKVGVQFREASHLSDYVDYTGNAEGPYGVPFIEWAKANDIHYDFIGVSFYPIYTNPEEVDMEHVYKVEFAPIKDHPDRLPDSLFEIHEYSAMAQIKKGNFVWLSNSYDAAYFANLAKMVFENGIAKVHQWRKSSYDLLHTPEVLTKATLDSMVGKIRFENEKSGQPLVEGNIVDGIFTQSTNGREIDVLIFNYNADPEYMDAEPVTVSVKSVLAEGADYQYRVATYGKEQCSFQQFAADYPKAMLQESDGGWVLDGISANGQPMKSLNKKGNAFFESVAEEYVKFNELQWSEWSTATVGEDGIVELSTDLPSFSFQKFEVRM